MKFGKVREETRKLTRSKLDDRTPCIRIKQLSERYFPPRVPELVSHWLVFHVVCVKLRRDKNRDVFNL